MRFPALRAAALLTPVLALGGACPAVSAQPIETVEVDGGLVGVWKFRMSQSFAFHPLGKSEWGPNADNFCQIEKVHDGLTVHCLGLRLNRQDVSRGTVSIHGDRIRMTWGSMLFYAVINGTFHASDQFDGTLSIQVLGIASDAPEKATGTKLTLSANAADKGEKSALLTRMLKEMGQGAVTVPVDADASNVKILRPDTLRPMGNILSVIYLGEKSFRFAPVPTAPSSVYDVEFDNGHLICELRQGTDGGLNYFDCG